MEPSNHIPRIGPYSRLLSRGAIGGSIDGRSREGRFLRAFEAELTKHIGGNPTVTQRVLIRRAARAMLRLELFDEKMAAGEWTDKDGKVYGGLSNSIRLIMRELGLKGSAVAANPADTLHAYIKGNDADDRENHAA
jgi:hypothetical protein